MEQRVCYMPCCDTGLFTDIFFEIPWYTQCKNTESNACKFVERDSSRLWKNMRDGFITTKRMTDQRVKIFKETRRSCQLTARLRCCLGVNSRCYLQEITRGMLFFFSIQINILNIKNSLEFFTHCLWKHQFSLEMFSYWWGLLIDVNPTL